MNDTIITTSNFELCICGHSKNQHIIHDPNIIVTFRPTSCLACYCIGFFPAETRLKNPISYSKEKENE